jgi:hypothetical protein
MGGTCGTRGREVHVELLSEDLRERDHVKDLGVDGWIIIKWIFKK